ncbi:MAG: insulinase family protein, partial [Bacteroidales bacterium]|nr:insulinase family protein [Bacteroidales bacterium]
LYEEKERITAALLCNLLGGPASNSLLNRNIREKHGWVYSIECSYTQYADTGIVAISFGCDRPNLESCLGAIDKVLAELRERPLSPSRLKAAKKQAIGQLAISSESGEAQCLSMGKSLLSWGKVPAEGDMRRAIEAVTAEELQTMAGRLFSPEKISRLIYL